MLVRRFEMPWRTACEFYASCAWMLAAGIFLHVTAAGHLPRKLGAPLLAACMLMAVLRLLQALRVLSVRASLSGHAMQVISTERLRRLTRRPDRVFLGFGFEWQPVHSQRLYELAKVDYRDYLVPPWLLRVLGHAADPQPDAEIGLPYIHGVGLRETPLYRPLQNFEGRTVLVGTTQAGKGVALGTLITQAIRRQDVVIVIDPKNSKRLKRIAMRACEDYRNPDTFLWFHPAFPESGVRLDFTFNWQKPTEIASRIQSVMPPDTAGAFSAFGWDAINVVVQGLVDLEQRPNLMKLTRYIEGGIEPVLEASLRRFYDAALGPGWRERPEMRRLIESAQRGTIRRPSESASTELLALAAFYEHHVPDAQRNKVIDAQVRTFRHNRGHYRKITANLLPILSMLTSGDLGRSLSPDAFDAADTRPMMNFEKIERAGMRYNLGSHRRISLFVDEVSNVINQPLIEIMNKGAEGGTHTTCAMQTLAGLSRRLGSEHAARMALGNLNNLIALRSKDRPTQDFVVETFGKTAIHTMHVGLNTAADAHLGDLLLECDRDKGEIYVRPVGSGSKPLSLFVSSASATYTLLLRRASTAADTIVIRDRTPRQDAKARSSVPARSAGHVRSLKAMLVAMASDKVPPDIRAEEVNVQKPCGPRCR
jgi:conjugal transfer pilus assembly protein TraD